MASPGAAVSKGPAGKKKGTTLHLTSFLKPEATSWADDDPESDIAAPPLPTAPGGSVSSYGSQERQSQQPSHHAQTPALPSQPPFKAYVANLAHNISAQEIGELFHASFKVVDVHILKHMDTGRVKGAFVEFATQEDLQGGLTMSGQMLAGRPLRVDVASGRRGGQEGRGYDDRGRGGYDDMRRGSHEDRGGYHERGPPHGDSRDRHGGYQDRSEFGGRGGYGSRGGFPDRRGPPDTGLSDRRNTNSGYSEEDTTERWGHKHVPAPVQTPRSQPPGVAAPSSPGPPTERKRLVLAPRSSKPLEGDASPVAAAATAEETAADKPRKSNPFGAAKPINAEARLKELEEKIAKEKAERAAAAREAEQRAREQAEAAGSGVDQEGSAQPAEASHTVEDTRPTGSGRFQGPPPGTTRNPGAPPSGSGRGQGRGASLDAANGRLSVPPGMEVSREEHGGRGGRGRRGRGREGGRGRGEYGGRGRGVPGYPDSRGPPAAGPTNILTHKESDPSGFQEAGPAKSKGRFRGWETHTPATAPRVDHSHQATESLSADKEAAPTKASNKFEMLTLDE